MIKRAIVLAALALAGCANIIHGSYQSVAVDSSPIGAQVIVDGGAQGATTPAVFDLKRDRAHLLLFRKAGYNDSSMTIVPELSGWIFGNIIFGPVFGLVGVIIDAHTGAMYSLSLDQASAILMPVSSAPNMLPRVEGPVTLTCWRDDREIACP